MSLLNECDSMGGASWCSPGHPRLLGELPGLDPSEEVPQRFISQVMPAADVHRYKPTFAPPAPCGRVGKPGLLGELPQAQYGPARERSERCSTHAGRLRRATPVVRSPPGCLPGTDWSRSTQRCITPSMSVDLREQLLAENKVGKPGSKTWCWDMTRTVASLFNSGGGVLRVCVDDKGRSLGVADPEAYAADKSPLAKALHEYLDPVPAFEPSTKSGHVEIRVECGATSPCILRKVLEDPHNPQRKYPRGTVFIRRMNGPQASSEPPQDRSDWQTVLHLWEANRGVTLQGPLLGQFCLVINKWDPFDPANTRNTQWELNCIADVAETIGRVKLHAGLKEIVKDVRPSPPRPSPTQDFCQAGADFKRPLLKRVERLCHDLGMLGLTRLAR